MMNEEKYIEERVGKRNPFQVPEGYFDSLADNVMASLPERKAQPKAKSVWLRPWQAAAAVVCVLLMSAVAWFWQSVNDQQTIVQAPVQQVQITEESFDAAADYMMLDNQDIYAYMAEN